MHRAKYLASKVEGKERILFTTYTTNLAGDIRENLRKICTTEELRRIEVINLDAWVMQFMREQGFSYTIAYDDQLNELWEMLSCLPMIQAALTAKFFMEEWLKVFYGKHTQKKFI